MSEQQLLLIAENTTNRRCLQYHFYNLYREVDLNEEKRRLSRALGAAKDQVLLKRAMEFALSDEVRTQDAVVILTSVSRNRHGRELAWQFFKENWTALKKRYGGGYLMNSLIKMNQLCKVCGEPAAGFHFGAFTCEGCKSFFGRTYNNLSSLSECKNSGRCVINKKNRTSCKSCRLRKCLMVGMSKSGSRYGRRSNWFKIHCLLQDQAHMNGQLDGGLSYGDLSSKMVYPAKEDGKDDELLTGSPDSHSDSYGEMDSKMCNGYDGQVKSGSLSPLSTYESPSPPYDKKEPFLQGIPMSPLSPMSPLAALHHQKFFGQAAAAAAAAGLLQNGYSGFHRLTNGSEPMAFRPYAPLNQLDFLLKKRKAFVFDVAPSCTTTEQELPMDLSVKKAVENAPEEVRAVAEEGPKDEPGECGPSGHRGTETPLDLTKKGLPVTYSSQFSPQGEAAAVGELALN